MRAGILLFLFFLVTCCGWSQSVEKIKDLRGYWKVAKGDQLEDYRGQSVRSIHLLVNDQFKGGILVIQAPGEFTLFINGQLQLRGKFQFRLNVDSLLKLQPGATLLSIFHQDNVKTIQTDLIYRGQSEDENSVRVSSWFNDFVILSSLMLFGFFVILFRTNTRLTSDYLNIVKVLSFQEREEAIVTGRIGSSVNILFFVFISLLSGMLLIIIFNLGPPVLQFSSKVTIGSASEYFIWWLLFLLLFLFF